MATTAPFCELFEHRLGIPKSTAMAFAQRLRKDKSVLRRGRAGRAAVDLTAQEVVNWTIALCAATSTARKGPDPIQTVKLARSAPRIRSDDLDKYCPLASLEGLGLAGAETFGEAIDSLIADMRSGAYARWHGSVGSAPQCLPYTLRVRFIDNAADIVINAWRWRDGAAQEATLVFRAENHPGARHHDLSFTHELSGFALEDIATVLGPLPEPSGGSHGCTATSARASPLL